MTQPQRISREVRIFALRNEKIAFRLQQLEGKQPQLLLPGGPGETALDAMKHFKTVAKVMLGIGQFEKIGMAARKGVVFTLFRAAITDSEWEWIQWSDTLFAFTTKEYNLRCTSLALRTDETNVLLKLVGIDTLAPRPQCCGPTVSLGDSSSAQQTFDGICSVCVKPTTGTTPTDPCNSCGGRANYN